MVKLTFYFICLILLSCFVSATTPMINTINLTTNQTTPDAELSCVIEASNSIETHSWYDTPEGSLVAYYPFNNAGAGDITGNENNGTVTGATYNITEGAYSFDGGTDQINMGNIRPQNNMTFSLWFNINNTPDSTEYIIHGDNRFQCFVDAVSGGRFFCNSKNDAWGDETSFTFLLSEIGFNEWVHFVYTLEVINSTKWMASFYRDGELLTSKVWTRNSISAFKISSSSGAFDGLIDEVNVFNRALTGEEVKEIYLQQAQYKDLVLNLPFDEEGATDWSRHQNNGTVTGATYNSTFGNYDFDGVDDYIYTSGYRPVFDEMTFSWWYKPLKDDNYQRIINLYPTYSWFLEQNSETKLRLLAWNATDALGYWVLDCHNVTAQEWTHATVVFNYTHLLAYCDGSLASTKAWIGGSMRNPIYDLDIGSDRKTQRNFNGSIDDVKIWSRALSQEEISRMYDKDKCTYNTSLTGCRDSYLNATATTSEGTYTCNAVASDLYSYSAKSSDSVSLLYCVPNWVNTTWSGWVIDGDCTISNLQWYNRSLIQYDSVCVGSLNTTHWEYTTSSCDYCSYNLIYDDWSESSFSCGWRVYNDSSWSSCCSVTGITSDCYSLDNQTFQYIYNESANCLNGLTANESSCLLTGYLPNGDLCGAWQQEKNNNILFLMGGLFFLFFVLAIGLSSPNISLAFMILALIHLLILIFIVVASVYNVDLTDFLSTYMTIALICIGAIVLFLLLLYSIGILSFQTEKTKKVDDNKW